MRIGYVTNGFAHHRLEDTLPILAALGYESVAITLDHHALDPYAPETPAQAVRIRELLAGLKLSCVVETGSRFLLDPWRKHQPTLLSPDPQERGRRSDFLRRAIDLAHDLGAEAVSFWSGTPEEGMRDEGWERTEEQTGSVSSLIPHPSSLLLDRLVAECRRLCDHAAGGGVRLAFEPEPGMLIDTMPRFAELHRRVAHPAFGLTLDVGHLHCQGEVPIADHVRRWREWLWNVHIEDMRRGVHDHLMFGEGEMDFPPVLAALREVGYAGGVHVELSRHSHDAVRTARRALAFLREAGA
jgi:sugar phosphate isomerase/epimerase